ncbi:PiggyBac transposable element-derived protein 4 [Cucumispora dikerogammari]|nr:PiggyBac transposable element-derived protein 4 [Cucumispora dikerogammari]
MKGQMILINDGVINIILLQDRKFVILLSTSNSVRENEYKDTGSSIITDDINYKILEKIKTPKFIDDYNQNMGGIDFFDQKIGYYDTNRKSSRWTFKLTLFILNI